MKKIIYNFFVLSFCFVSCERSLESTYEELNELEQEANQFEYTISSDDYEEIIPSNDEDVYESNSAFLSEDEALELIPSIISQYFDGGDQDKVVVNFNVFDEDYSTNSESITAATGLAESLMTNTYTLESADYPVDGADAFLMDEETESTILDVLQSQFSNIENGDAVAVTYNTYIEEPTLIAGNSAIEDYTYLFDDSTFKGWEVVDVLGDQEWTASDEFDNISINGYVNGLGTLANEDWLVSPAIDLSNIEDPKVQIEQEMAFIGDISLLQVLISDDYSGDVETATWTMLSFENAPSADNDESTLSEAYDISDFSGSIVNVAFKYISTSSDATRWRISSFSFLEGGSDAYEGAYETQVQYYSYNNGDWTELSDVYTLTTENYDAFGEGDEEPGEHDNFSAAIPAENYIPQLLNNLEDYKYAQDNDIVYVGYNYWAGSSSQVITPFIKSENSWLIYDEDNYLTGTEIIESSLNFKYDQTLGIFVEDGAVQYTLVTDDYTLVAASLADDTELTSQVANLDQYGNFNRYPGDTYWDDSQIEKALNILLQENFADAEEESIYEVTFSAYGPSSEETVTLQFIDGEFSYYVEE